MATYLGNPSLSTAVKDRVMSTFEQALQLYKVGRTEEVVQGCGLILQMDPQFDPAKKLLEKARNPMAPIDIDKLVPAVTTGDALTEAREAMTRRDFQRVINITTEILTNDLMNEDARVLNDSAREKMEAAPFVDQFARKFDQSMANNDVTSARTNLEKARSLDPDHPSVTRMEKAVASGASAAPAPPATPTPAAPPASGGFSFDAPSFIVEAPPPVPGRGTAQASDFGFTFEEEKPSDGGLAGFSFEAPAPAPIPAPAPPPAAPTPPPAPPPAPSGHFSFDEPSGGGFSFDTPSPAPASGSFNFDASSSAPAAPAAPPSGDFDFSSASFETSDEDRRKIDQYLSDGDRAYDSGDYQQAIDLWSRIFLIDVTNEPASDRIEKAKAKRRETEQKVEPLITAGVAAFDRHDYDGARQKFNEALSVDPANSTATDYIERMSSSVAEGGAAATISDFIPPAAEKRDIFADDDSEGTYEVNIAPSPKAPAAEKKPAAKAAAARPARSGSRMGAVIAIVAVAILAGAGWFVYSKFVSKPPIDPTATNAIFSKATTQAQQGKYDLAIATLQDVKPEDPQHDRAVIMIADLQHKKSVAAAMIDGKPAAQYFSDQVNTGRAAYDAHDFDGAKRAFEQAMRVRPLPPDVKPLYDTSAQQVAKLDAAKSLFKEHRFADAIGNLEQLKAQDPQNKNIERMIVDAHFNLGAAALQEERLPDAIKEFDEVLKIDPSDDLAKRSRELAVRYNDQTKDLLFKIYVKYLPMRQVA